MEKLGPHSDRSSRKRRPEREVEGFKEVLDADCPDIKLLDVQYIGSDAGKAAGVTSSIWWQTPI